MQNLSSKQINILFTVFIAFLLFAGWNIYALIQNSGTRTVEIIKAPADTTVTLSGTEISGSSVRLKPGTYTFVAQREDFHDQEVTIVVNDSSDPVVELFLVPATEEMANKVQAGEDGFVYDEAVDFSTIADPVLSYLPYKNLLYSMEATTTTQPITVKITALNGYRNAAIERLKSQGLDPSDYLYEFNFASPF